MTDFQLVLPDDRDDGWLRLIDGTESVVATEVIAGPVAELVSHLAPGDTVSVMGDVLDDVQDSEIPKSEHKPHRCGGAELRVWRMRLAMLEWNEDAWAQVIAEIGDCPNCLRNAMANALHLHSNDFARNSGGNSRAADLTLKEISKAVMR
jgi:hypothetical protein